MIGLFSYLESGSPEPVKEVVPIIPKFVPTVEIPVPTAAMEKLSLDEVGSERAQLFNRILSTILERQAVTDECIEISNAVPRTARLE